MRIKNRTKLIIGTKFNENVDSYGDVRSGIQNRGAVVAEIFYLDSREYDRHKEFLEFKHIFRAKTPSIELTRSALEHIEDYVFSLDNFSGSGDVYRVLTGRETTGRRFIELTLYSV